jgi:hypothetical protein
MKGMSGNQVFYAIPCMISCVIRFVSAAVSAVVDFDSLSRLRNWNPASELLSSTRSARAMK